MSSNESFNPTNLTVGKLLTDSDSLYQIPQYQRPYKWTDDQVDQLWLDLKESFENDEPNYFLGSIITSKPEKTGSYLDVVDGQQRLTTLIILLAVVRDLYPTINEEECEVDPSAIDVTKVKNAIQQSEKFGRLRVFTHVNHRTDFDNTIVNGNTLVLKKPMKKDVNRDEEPKFKFQNTACIFRAHLEEMGLKQSGEFINYLFNRVRIIRIDCTNPSFAIKLFQVLNARGLDLSNADLIKSFLIAKLRNDQAEDPETLQHREDQFMQNWREVEGIASTVYEGLNDLFVMYEYYLLGANPKKSLYEELTKLFENRKPLEVIGDFKKFCEHYRDDVFEIEDAVTYSMFYLRWSVYWKTLFTSAYHANYPDMLELKKAVRRFYYLHWVAGFTLSRIKQISFNMLKWIREKRPIHEIKHDLETVLRTNSVVERVIDELSGNIYQDPWCKPLLIMCEYNQVDNPAWIPIWDGDIHVEHILPQNFEDKYGWKQFIDRMEEAKPLVHSCGNLTLLSGAKNIEARNDPYERKIKAYTGKGFYNDDNAKITSFRITQKLVDHYNEGRYDKEWNFDSIKARRQWFLGQLENILAVDLTDAKK